MDTVNKNHLIRAIADFRPSLDNLANGLRKTLVEQTSSAYPNYPVIVQLSRQLTAIDMKRHAFFMAAFTADELNEFETHVLVYELQKNAHELAMQIAIKSFDNDYQNALRDIVSLIASVLHAVGVESTFSVSTDEIAASYGNSLSVLKKREVEVVK